MDNFNLSEKLSQLLVDFGPKLIGAILVLIIGLWISKQITKAVKKLFTAKDFEPSLTTFLSSLLGGVLKVLVVISAMSMLGIQMTSFIAILGAAGLAIGMALSGTLQNFAGGVMILIFKPFKVGDFIEAQGHAGVVKEIQIFNTILKTGDNKTIILPNAPVSNGSMTNYSTEAERRVDFTFGIDYSDDIDKAKSVLKELYTNDERVLADKPLLIAVSELGDSSVNIIVRAWVKSENYWGLFWDMQELVKKTFDKEGLSFPFPQTDIHVVDMPK